MRSTIGFLYWNMVQHPKPEAVFLPKSKLVMLKNHLLLNPYRYWSCIGSSNSDLKPLVQRWNFRCLFSVFHSPQPERSAGSLRVRPKQVGLKLLGQRTDLDTESSVTADTSRRKGDYSSFFFSMALLIFLVNALEIFFCFWACRTVWGEYADGSPFCGLLQ